ncbi:MAG: hypothetical protein EXR16_03950 [Bacteroidetes bacterium]|nr:hypothetical protein [Bacteroidota bacterium]
MSDIIKLDNRLQKYTEPKGFFSSLFSSIKTWWNDFTGRTSSQLAEFSVEQLNNDIKELRENDIVLYKASEKFIEEIELIRRELLRLENTSITTDGVKTDNTDFIKRISVISESIKNLKIELQEKIIQNTNTINAINEDFGIVKKDSQEVKRLTENLNLEFHKTSNDIREQVNNFGKRINEIDELTDKYKELKNKVSNDKASFEEKLELFNTETEDSLNLILTRMHNYKVQGILIALTILSAVLLIDLFVIYFKVLTFNIIYILLLDIILIIFFILFALLFIRKERYDK